jgi:hypothetical protein
MKKIFIFCALLVSLISAEEQSNFYAIRISITHETIYDHTAWNAITSLIKELITFNQERNNGSGECYYACLWAMDGALQEINKILESTSTIQCTVSTFRSEESVVSNEQGIEIILSFKLADSMPQEHKESFEKSLAEFFAASNESPQSAFKIFHATIPHAFSVMSGESSTSINDYETGE